MDEHAMTLRRLADAAERASGPDGRLFHAQLAAEYLAGDTSFVVGLGSGWFGDVPTAALEALAAVGAIAYVEPPGPWGAFRLTDAGVAAAR